MKSGARVDGGKLKINENGEMYIERRGRKPGPKAKRFGSSRSSYAGGGAQSTIRRASVRNAIKKEETQSPSALLAALVRKYSSRRSILFKSHCPTRSPYARAAVVTRETVWHQNIMYRVGDIVKVLDASDGLPYFAQIRGFITDPLVNNYVALTWLVPKRCAPDPHLFDNPAHFAHAVVDRKNYPIESCVWVQSRPELASYHADWSNNRILADRRREELVNRNQQLLQVAETELMRYGDTPVVDLVTRKNDEPR